MVAQKKNTPQQIHQSVGSGLLPQTSSPNVMRNPQQAYTPITGIVPQNSSVQPKPIQGVPSNIVIPSFPQLHTTGAITPLPIKPVASVLSGTTTQTTPTTPVGNLLNNVMTAISPIRAGGVMQNKDGTFSPIDATIPQQRGQVNTGSSISIALASQVKPVTIKTPADIEGLKQYTPYVILAGLVAYLYSLT